MKIATLLSPVLAISLKNTPPLNEVYETLLRVKHDSKDGHEKLLLELSDLSKDWQKNQSENDSIISSLKSDLSKMKKDLNSAEKKISSSETDHEALKKLMDKIVSDLQQKMDLAETTINQQHNQAQELIERVDYEIRGIKEEVSSETVKSLDARDSLSSRLDQIEIRQEEFIRMTKSQLANLDKIEEHNREILKNIEEREKKNIQGINTINKFEETTQNRLEAQETELRMVSRSLRAMQNRLSIDEFKEEKLQDTMTQMTLEMLNKIASLEMEIKEVLNGSTPVEREKLKQMIELSHELKTIEGLVIYQQEEIQQMDMNNMAQVSELKKTDTKLRSKLSTVEQDINKLGAGIIFRSEFMKKFNY